MNAERKCSNCGAFLPMGKVRRGRCMSCAKYFRLNGTERPEYFWSSKFCSNCSESLAYARGRCEACNRYFCRHGAERPRHYFKDATCMNCKKPLLNDRCPTKGFCENCRQYSRRNNGKNRPKRLWGVGPHGWCDCGQPAVELIEDIPVCKACFDMEMSKY